MNVSEGRDGRILDRLAAACGPALLDRHADADHHRSVFTVGGPLAAVEPAVRRLAAAVAEHVSLEGHAGVHPRFGALDVVPFVALDPAGREEAAAAARGFAAWWAGRGVPVFLYDDADPARRSLPAARRDAFRARRPDLGPREPHPALGATAVGARRPLVALNCELDTADAGVADRIARAVRETGGGLPGVRALGFLLAGRGRAQVSMNLVDLDATGVEAVCRRVRDLAGAEGAGVTRVELVGLLPGSELDRCSAEFLAWSALDPDATIERRLAAVGLHRPPPAG